MNCPNCGNNIPDNSAACGFCGAKFGAPAQQVAPNAVPAYAAPVAAPAPKKSKKKLIITLSIIGGAILSIIIGAVLFVQLFGMECDKCGDTVLEGRELLGGEYFVCNDCYEEMLDYFSYY